MVVDSARELTALVGSETRAGTLAVLANASQPLTGYRIAKLAACQESKVNSVLAELQAKQFVAMVSLGANRVGWVMEDPDLRRSICKRVRISWSEDLLRERKRNKKRAMALSRRLAALEPVDISRYAGFVPRNPEEFNRPPEKDATLIELGSRPSRRTKSGM